ncbi:MAG: hypothetical protein WC614_12695 [bacterium]
MKRLQIETTIFHPPNERRAGTISTRKEKQWIPDTTKARFTTFAMPTAGRQGMTNGGKRGINSGEPSTKVG